jgi:predicted RNase H-like HicB family nuclease
LGYSIFTQAESMDELRRNIREAVHAHFDGQDSPSVIRLHTVKDEVILA